ncbi:MAG: hypothetical protein II101_04190, partial [Ruminococcus sp.]|nr:hypothetical protein [Ruminococcus sp.]
ECNQTSLKQRDAAPNSRNGSLWVRKKDFPRYEAECNQTSLKQRDAASNSRNRSLWVRKKTSAL